MRKMKEVTVPKTTIVLADSLDAMADNVRKLSDIGTAIKSSRLTERAILVLLKDMTGLPQSTVKTVLDSLPKLERHYLK